jgi:hypothetical protein
MSIHHEFTLSSGAIPHDAWAVFYEALKQGQAVTLGVNPATNTATVTTEGTRTEWVEWERSTAERMAGKPAAEGRSRKANDLIDAALERRRQNPDSVIRGAALDKLFADIEALPDVDA